MSSALTHQVVDNLGGPNLPGRGRGSIAGHPRVARWAASYCGCPEYCKCENRTRRAICGNIARVCDWVWLVHWQYLENSPTNHRTTN